MKRIFSYLKPYKALFVLTLVIVTAVAFLNTVPSMITSKVVDGIVNGDPFGPIFKLIFIGIACVVVNQAISLIETFINSLISSNIIRDMRNEMYLHIQSMPYAFFTTEKQADIINRVTTDINDVSHTISRTAPMLLKNLMMVIATFAALWALDIRLALVGLVVTVVLIVPANMVGKQRKKIVRQSQQEMDNLNNNINETFSPGGAYLVKVFTGEKHEYRKFSKINSDIAELMIADTMRTRVPGAITGIFFFTAPLIVYLVACIMIQKSCNITIGEITAAITLLTRLYSPVDSVGSLRSDYIRATALFNRVFEYLDRESTIVSPENGVKPDMSEADIEFKHVAFSYDGENTILKDINIKIPANKTFALVGPSGSGKSSIVNLIPRLYDVGEGSVTVAGADVRDMDLAYLRNHVGIIAQDSHLFNDTIMSNLLYAKADATQEEIDAACKAANIYDFIMTLPEKYDTVVGNRGFKLSGGEKQRISIARVLLKNPTILIMDEATAALDSITEKAIQEALDPLMENRTGIIIAHRLSTILKADKILVVSNGEIVEEGTHKELLEKDGLYKELYDTQFHIQDEAEDQEGLNLTGLSSCYDVRRVEPDEANVLYELFRDDLNIYRRGGNPRQVCHEYVKDVYFHGYDTGMYLLGYYRDDHMMAAANIMLNFPEEEDVRITWFNAVDEEDKAAILGLLIADMRASFKAQGFKRILSATSPDAADRIEMLETNGFSRVEENDEFGQKVIWFELDIQ